ncbi:hypothetical protein TVAG_240790 [Trichomonas vaginalis G3]|uniref:Deoxynucleoside kinase domain-containing protein n=1 Tax=Trichomonas vaginalis (strain ATCC PRA-98 / G3) TaxID=412133 RepID=A2EJC6_TRIV3|nr:deoxynucleoside kinase family [Trichomonas vaginalis G3]EAY07278.1 hypothetical protein TVAG_240790 [Trichomonas vaginalis G3]KAI5511950.1 deoxynucleoside kinase family [Trichomonas vaginalis G3]|eukprot:XP_001319501.1 hypothetical protein [Trichomonas vaginalis G3]
MIFCDGDETVLEKARAVQNKYGIQGFAGDMKVITINNYGQSPNAILNEILGTIFGTKNVTPADIQHLANTSGVVIYLKSTPDLCMERMRKRGRGPEAKTKYSFIEGMCNKYENYINRFTSV